MLKDKTKKHMSLKEREKNQANPSKSSKPELIFQTCNLSNHIPRLNSQPMK
jgi:hypothetical protein